MAESLLAMSVEIILSPDAHLWKTRPVGVEIDILRFGSPASGDLTFRYGGVMRVIPARRRGGSPTSSTRSGVVVTRGNRPVAEIRPAHRRTGKDLRAALAETAPPDDKFAADIGDAMTYVNTDGTDPWADA